MLLYLHKDNYVYQLLTFTHNASFIRSLHNLNKSVMISYRIKDKYSNPKSIWTLKSHIKMYECH